MEKYIKQVFIDEKNRDDKFLTEDDLNEILDERNATSDDVRKGIVGYPSHPLYRQISGMLQEWMDSEHCPVLDLPKYDLLDEQSYIQSRALVIASVTPLLTGLKTLHTMWGDEEIKYRIREVVNMLGKRGLLDLLGVRKTVGTKDLWPCARSKLHQSFNAAHSEKAVLSVGARALAKHHHRDETSSWWGTSLGTEAEKNAHALRLMNLILDKATWINIHWLPQEIFVIEVRVIEGYGARWTADGEQFRGFVEPQMIDGHEVGWRH